MERGLATFTAIAEPLAEKGNPPDLETGFFKLAQGSTFGLDRMFNPVDDRIPGESATCCGVNLAVAAPGVLVFGDIGL
jgi:hypothetical protein